MERCKIGADETFRMLVLASQATNIKLVDVAGHLIETGHLAAPQDLTPAGRARAASTTVGRSNHYPASTSSSWSAGAARGS